MMGKRPATPEGVGGEGGGKLLFAGMVLSPTLRHGTRDVALVLLVIGGVLSLGAVVVSGSASETAAAWGAGFVGLGAMLLAVVGFAAVGGKVIGVVAHDVKTELDGHKDKDGQTTPDDDLSDNERELIALLREKGVPTETVTKAIRKGLEREEG